MDLHILCSKLDFVNALSSCASWIVSSVGFPLLVYDLQVCFQNSDRAIV